MINDRELVQSFRNGNMHAADILIERYKSSLNKLCNKLTMNQNDSDDLFQDTWVKVFKYIKKYDEKKSFKTWIYTICVNTYKDKYNKKKRWMNIVKDYFTNDEKSNELNKISDGSKYTEDMVIENDDYMSLRKKIMELDDKLRIPLVLFYFKEFNYSELSEIMDIPIGTVKSRLNTAKKRLKESLIKEEFYV